MLASAKLMAIVRKFAEVLGKKPRTSVIIGANHTTHLHWGMEMGDVAREFGKTYQGRAMNDIDVKSIEGYDPDEALKLSNQLCFPLYACSKEVIRRYTPYLDSLGLTYTQYITLMVLWENDGITVGELGEKLLLDSGTLTPLLKKMEAHGLLTRHRSESDERRVVVSLTQAGSDLKAEAAKVPLAMAGCVQLSPEEGAELVRLLSKVLDNVRTSRE